MSADHPLMVFLPQCDGLGLWAVSQEKSLCWGCGAPGWSLCAWGAESATVTWLWPPMPDGAHLNLASMGVWVLPEASPMDLWCCWFALSPFCSCSCWGSMLLSAGSIDSCNLWRASPELDLVSETWYGMLPYRRRRSLWLAPQLSRHA